MHLHEAFRLALRQVRQEKLKSFFGVVSVVIGVMFLIVVVSAVEGMDRYITEDFSDQVFGVNTVQIRQVPQVQVNTNVAEQREWSRHPPLTLDEADAVRRGMTVPARVGVESRATGEVRSDTGVRIDNVQIAGISEEILAIRTLQVEVGRPFSAQEAQRGIPVVVLGRSVADALFPDVDPRGERVRIQGFPFRVIGVLEERGSLFGISLDNLVLVPAQAQGARFISLPGTVDGIIVQTPDPADLEVAVLDAEAALRAYRGLRPDEVNDFHLGTADDSLAFWDRIATALFIALPLLVGISLVVGGIVIMNIMLISVMERTREIGVRMAVGARREDIVHQFLIEAVAMSGGGAVIGVMIGMGLTALVRTTTPLPAALAVHWVALGVVLGLGVGTIAGVYPAVRASRMDPVEALRHE